MLFSLLTAVESSYGCGSLWRQGATQECHTKTDRRTEKYNKINIKQDCRVSSILSGSTIALRVTFPATEICILS
jgi:hypothetical protein